MRLCSERQGRVSLLVAVVFVRRSLRGSSRVMLVRLGLQGDCKMQARRGRNTTALATLRIVVGVFFVLFGEYKVFGTDFIVRHPLRRYA